MPVSSSVSRVAAGLALGVLFALPATAQHTTRKSDVITREEIEHAQVEDAYQVVLRLRPEFLQRADRPQPGTGADEDPGGGSGVFGRGVTVGGVAPAASRGSDPYSPEFDQGQSAAAGGPNEGSGGLAAPAGATPDRSVAAGAPRHRIVVYVGTTPIGGIEELTTLAASALKEIRYLRPSEAQFRFGPRHTGGAIVVTLLE